MKLCLCRPKPDYTTPEVINRKSQDGILTAVEPHSPARLQVPISMLFHHHRIDAISAHKYSRFLILLFNSINSALPEDWKSNLRILGELLSLEFQHLCNTGRIRHIGTYLRDGEKSGLESFYANLVASLICTLSHIYTHETCVNIHLVGCVFETK